MGSDETIKPKEIIMSDKISVPIARSLHEKLKAIYEKADEIINSDLPWKQKYNRIFSQDISHSVFSLVDLDYSLVGLDYCDDTSYEEDVKAFVNALKDKCQDLNII